MKDGGFSEKSHFLIVEIGWKLFYAHIVDYFPGA